MKNKLFFLNVSIIVLFSISKISAQTSTIPWTASGTNTYTNPLGNNVGINTTTPLGKLHVNNGSVLFDGATTGATPTSGVGTRMMWIPTKSAFRAGLISALPLFDQWDAANIGIGSCAFNQNTKASGANSAALGIYTTASNAQAFACGYTTVASGPNSFASGYLSQATGDKATAISWGNLASGTASFATGSGTVASGAYSSSFGYHPTASGQSAIAAGTYTTAQSFSSFVIGRYNKTGTYSATTWVGTDPVFVIGNGTGTGTFARNAVTVLKNGNVGIGTELLSNPNNYRLAVNGSIGAKEVKIETSSTTWPDYVFDKDYVLLPLNELDAYLKKNNHLPDIPGREQVKTDNGVYVGEMQVKLLQKIEELTLYLLEQNREFEKIKIELELLKK
ncbi:MAG TPA: hypothetical protein VGC65_01055 [Bacteroidia bacterium]|jgi:hypothetical protein